MRPVHQAGLTGFFLACTLLVAGCSDSSSSSAPQNDASIAGDDGPVVAGSPTVGSGTPTEGDGRPAADAGTPSTLDGNAPQQPPRVQNDGETPDNSPTRSESLSLAGPNEKDETRGAGPPSAPSGLTALLLAEDWVEFNWAPSQDDQSIARYDIYRDGTLLHSVTDNQAQEYEYRHWLSTSYIDCNYTRNTDCQTQQPAPGSTHSYYVIAVDNEGMSSAPSEEATFTLETRQSTPVDMTGYELIFDEEFEGDTLDRATWKTSLPWGPDEIINGETQYFVNTFGSKAVSYDPFRFSGTSLQITGIETPPELAAQANNQPYLSGVISTSDNFAMTYGYVEMSARVAGGNGLLSTFYLFNDDYEKNKPEIDIAEYIGSRPDKVYQTYHYYDSDQTRIYTGEKHSSPTMETAGNTDFSTDFHRYGVLWEPELMVWYVDGQEVRRITGPRVSDEPMHIIAHMVMGSQWIGSPDETTTLPAVFEIDSIKAWQKAP